MANAVEYIRYDAYGSVTGRFDHNQLPKFSANSDLTFTGQSSRASSELVDFGKRFYDPEIGLFLTPDPRGPIFIALFICRRRSRKRLGSRRYPLLNF